MITPAGALKACEITRQSIFDAASPVVLNPYTALILMQFPALDCVGTLAPDHTAAISSCSLRTLTLVSDDLIPSRRLPARPRRGRPG
jgi:hypothetical protein